MRLMLATAILLALATAASADWKPCNVQQLNGNAPRIQLSGQWQFPAGDSEVRAALPYMVYMPEKDQVLMTIGSGDPMVGMVTTSSNRGATWSALRFMGVDGQGKSTFSAPIGLSYMGKGHLATGVEPYPNGWVSLDYGVTWDNSGIRIPALPGAQMYAWDPVLVDRDPKTGKVTQLTLAMYRQEDPNQLYSSQGYIFTSKDEGKTWTTARLVPEWKNVNEIALVRAKNGDLIASCRTDNPQRFWGGIDHYCGVGMSVSKDNGATWSKLNHLYEYGRHHGSMVVLRNGAIVMSYIVRIGYTDDADGLPRFGVEAVVSRDNGKTWDLDHRYILASWKGNQPGYGAAPQNSTSVVLPDDTILTAFSLSDHPLHPGRTVDVIRWRPNFKGLNKDHAYGDTPWDSEARNKIDPGKLTIAK